MVAQLCVGRGRCSLSPVCDVGAEGLGFCSLQAGMPAFRHEHGGNVKVVKVAVACTQHK